MLRVNEYVQNTAKGHPNCIGASKTECPENYIMIKLTYIKFQI